VSLPTAGPSDLLRYRQPSLVKFDPMRFMNEMGGFNSSTGGYVAAVMKPVVLSYQILYGFCWRSIEIFFQSVLISRSFCRWVRSTRGGKAGMSISASHSSMLGLRRMGAKLTCRNGVCFEYLLR